MARAGRRSKKPFGLRPGVAARVRAWGALLIALAVATAMGGIGYLNITHSKAYWAVPLILAASAVLGGAGRHLLRTHPEPDPRDPHARRLWVAGLVGGAVMAGGSLGYSVYSGLGPMEPPEPGLTRWSREEYRVIGNASYTGRTVAPPEPAALGLEDPPAGPTQEAPTHTARLWIRIDWDGRNSLYVVLERDDADGGAMQLDIEPGKAVSVDAGSWSGTSWRLRVSGGELPLESTDYTVSVTYEAIWVFTCTTDLGYVGMGEDGGDVTVDGNNPGPCTGQIEEYVVS